MKVDANKVDGAVVVTPSGEIVSRRQREVVSELVARKMEEGERRFVLDLARVPYIGSQGIVLIVTMQVKLAREGGSLRLVNTCPKVAQVLEMTKVSDMVRSYPTVEQALSTK